MLLLYAFVQVEATLWRPSHAKSELDLRRSTQLVKAAFTMVIRRKA